MKTIFLMVAVWCLISCDAPIEDISMTGSETMTGRDTMTQVDINTVPVLNDFIEIKEAEVPSSSLVFQLSIRMGFAAATHRINVEIKRDINNLTLRDSTDTLVFDLILFNNLNQGFGANRIEKNQDILVYRRAATNSSDNLRNFTITQVVIEFTDDNGVAMRKEFTTNEDYNL